MIDTIIFIELYLHCPHAGSSPNQCIHLPIILTCQDLRAKNRSKSMEKPRRNRKLAWFTLE